MSQIKLTPEELRISAQKYTTGSQSITDVLTVLTQEQAVIDENWDGTAFDSFEANSMNYLQKSHNLHNY